MCQPAPIVNQFGRDVARRFGIPTIYGKAGPGGVFLGSVGDQRHSVKRSSHNCASAPGGQESPVNGVSYAPQYAHAWDARPATSEVGYQMVEETLADPFLRIRYVLYHDHGWYPDGTFEDITDNDQWDLDHDTFHVSFLPGTHDDTRPFFTDQGEFTVADIDRLIKAQEATTAAVKAERLSVIAQGQKTRATFRHQSALTRQAIAEGNGDTVAAKEAETEAKQAKAEADAIDDAA